MEHLNQEQREQLAAELAGLKFNQAKWRLLKMDPDGRIKYFRNTQRLGFLATRFELPSFGTRVTLYEQHASKADPTTNKIKGEYKLAEVEVEPLSAER
jgi:hypothetical protein